MLVASIAGAATSFLLGHVSLQNGLHAGIRPSAFLRIRSHIQGLFFSRVSYIGKLWPKSSCLEPEEAENLPAYLIHVLPAPFPGYKDEHYSALAFQAVAIGRETLPGPMRSSIWILSS